MNKNSFRSGFVAIIGRPNVGKSTLLNALIGQKIAAVTSKPQTTRHKILGIKNFPKAQLLFLDTPGIHRPHRSLNEYMVEMARSTFQDANIFLFVTEPGEEISPEDRGIYEAIRQSGKPILVLINKVDKANRLKLLPLMGKWLKELKADVVIPISALNSDGLSQIEAEIIQRLPEGPSYFPEDQVTDQTERFLVSEIIRAKIMELTQEEVPYSVAIVIEEFKDPKETDIKKVIRIKAAIVTEKDSQKGILVGKGGQMIRKIGELSRKDIEAELGQQVFLELFVRVEQDWTKDPQKVQELAYS